MANTASTHSPLPVAVIGCGRMGALHARVYSQMPQVKLVGVLDVNAATAAAVAQQYGCQAFTDIEQLLPRVTAVTIATPTQSHAALAEPLLSRGIACLVEKPLAKTVAEARQIVHCAQQRRATLQVGHIERFNPAIRAVTRLGIRPGFIEVTRVSPLTFRSIDVGVVLDMMIHDIDIVLWLAQSPVARIDAVGVSVIGQVEDICNARLTFANGCVANMTASRLALKTDRKLRLFSRDAYVSLDYQKRQGTVARRGNNLQAIRDAVEKIRSGELQDATQLSYADLVQLENLDIDEVEPIRAELDAFVHAITTGDRPVVSGEDGLAAVEVAHRIVQAMGNPTL